jgi:hypothetical protein
MWEQNSRCYNLMQSSSISTNENYYAFILEDLHECLRNRKYICSVRLHSDE